MQNFLLYFMIFIVMISLYGCSISADNIDLTETRKIIVEKNHIEISGDIDVRDWQHIKPLHKMVSRETF